jgi:hypothetical protein
MNFIQQIAGIKPEGVYSQFNEDLIALHIQRHMNCPKTFVDIGAGAYDGSMSNTRLLREQGWDGIGFDAKEGPGIIQAMVSPENIIDLLRQAEIKQSFGFLNLDIDSCDYWVLREILEDYRPAFICTEFNGCLAPDIPVAQEYQPGYTWDGTHNYGYSFAAGKNLLESHGYTVVYNQHDTNIWAILTALLPPMEIPHVTAKRHQYHPFHASAKFVPV